MANGEEGFDLREALGASSAFAVQKFTIYLPNKDRNNQPIIDIEDYVQAAMTLLMEINSGVTRLPAAHGMFLDTKTNVVSDEDTHLVYSFLVNPPTFQARSEEIKRFLYDFGKNTNQASVLVEFSGEEPERDDGDGRSRGLKYVCRAYSIDF